MHFAAGNSEQTLKALCLATGATVVVANRLYEPPLYERDQRIEKSLGEADVTVKYFDSNLLFTPGSVFNQQQAPYKVFTPFWRACRAKLEHSLPPLSTGLSGSNTLARKIISILAAG
jgi:deoxyribodipyrimidine photo-lyase